MNDQFGDRRLSIDSFTAALRAVGDSRYHHKHPFNIRMHAGSLTEGELRLWIHNRFYYQRHIPVKDAVIISKLPTREDRRRWLQRVIDHDGTEDLEGDLEAWLRFGDAVGLRREAMWDDAAVLPGVRLVVDRYVSFCRERSWLESVATSLTELFAPALMARRIDDIGVHYPWIPSWGLQYFRDRLRQQPQEVDHALNLVLRSANTAQEQQACLRALRFKCDVLWALLDSIELRTAEVGTL